MAHIPPFTPIDVDRRGLTIMGVAFPDLGTLDGVARAVGTNMYEGLKPTPRDVEAIRDHCTGSTTFEEMVAATRSQYGTKEWPQENDPPKRDGRWDSEYTDLDIGVFYNLLGEVNRETLEAIEYRAAAKGAYDLRVERPKMKNSKDILEIHRRLLGNVYSWAGQTRRLDMRKGNSSFLPMVQFDMGFWYLDTLMSELGAVDGGDKGKVARLLAKMLDRLNHMHPYREGNGRTQRLAVELMAWDKGYDLDLNPPDDPATHQAYMRGTIDGDTRLLTQLMHTRLELAGGT